MSPPLDGISFPGTVLCLSWGHVIILTLDAKNSSICLRNCSKTFPIPLNIETNPPVTRDGSTRGAA